MSGSERQRRYLARLLGDAAKPHGAAKPDAAIAQELARNKKALAQANARIAELETAAQAQPRSGTLTKTKRRPADEWLHKPTKDEAHIMKLEARVRELEALVLPLDETQKDALRQHKRKVDRDYKNRLRESDKVIRQRTWVVDEATYRLWLAGMHPDTSKEMRDQARHTLERYKKRVLKKGEA